MKAQDFTDKDNERARVVDELIQVCTDLGLSYSFTEKQFKISLPHVNPVSVLPKDHPNAKKRKRFDISKWGKKGLDETKLAEAGDDEVNIPDELPPTTTPLDEGEPPKGDDEV